MIDFIISKKKLELYVFSIDFGIPQNISSYAKSYTKS